MRRKVEGSRQGMTGRRLKRGCECTSSICLTTCGCVEQAEPARSMSSDPACSAKEEFSCPRHSAEHFHRFVHEPDLSTVKTATFSMKRESHQLHVLCGLWLKHRCSSQARCLVSVAQKACGDSSCNVFFVIFITTTQFMFGKCVDFHSATTLRILDPATGHPFLHGSGAAWLLASPVPELGNRQDNVRDVFRC